MPALPDTNPETVSAGPWPGADQGRQRARIRWWPLFLLIPLSVLLFVPIPGAWTDFRAFNRTMDGLHAPFFALLTLLVLRLCPPNGKRRLALTGIAMAAAAGLVELLQLQIGRSASLVDFGFGICGIAAALLVVTAGARRVFVTIALLLTLLPLIPALEEWKARVDLGRQKPRLLTADTRFWQAQYDASVQVSGDRLKIVTLGGEYDGIYFQPGPMDWAGYNTLWLAFENPGDAFELGIRIDSRGGRRFYRSLTVPEENSTLPVELAGADSENLAPGRKVHRLVLFTGKEETGRTFYVTGCFLK